MSNIKNLQMWNDICHDARISVKKSMFGLCSTVIYNPTGSIVDARIIELSHTDGNRLRQILNTSGIELERIIGDYRPKPITNGNFMAEVCTSRDGAFLAIKLLQFSVLSYQSVTDTLIFEGDDARSVGKMF